MTDDEIKQLKEQQQAEEILDILSNKIIKVPRYRTINTLSGIQTYRVIVGIDEIPAAEFYRNKHRNVEGNNDEN